MTSREEMEPILYIDCSFNNTIVPISEKMRLALLSVGELRALVTRKTGLPIGKLVASTMYGHQVHAA